MIILSNDDGFFEVRYLEQSVEFMELVKKPNEWLLQEIDLKSPLSFKVKDCQHERTATARAENYEKIECVDCGKILKETC